MTVWITGDHSGKVKQWRELLSNAMPSTRIHTCSETNSHFTGIDDTYTLERNDIVICLTSRLDTSTKETIELALASFIPVLCIVENIKEELYKTLIHIGVKGIVDGNKTSLHTLKNAMRVITEGGIYIESSIDINKLNDHSLVETIVEPNLDLTEWSIFSLLSKGFTVTEISRKVDLSEEKINEYQLNIIEKTKSKILSEAKRTGPSRGYIPNN